jgi:endonuclease G
VDGKKIPTDVVQRSFKPGYELLAEQVLEKPDRKKRLDTISPGISVSHIKGTAGTLGCIVYDAADGTPYILSNWHVLHSSRGDIGDPVVQPGPFDDGDAQGNIVGHLVRSHLGLAGDCALATIESRGVDATVLSLQVIPKRIARAELGDKVVKSGRTTAVTHGIVRRVEVTIKLNYGGTVGEQRIGGFEIGPDPDFPAEENEISKGGDSGSIWLIKKKSGKPTDIVAGLHFAGEGQGDPDDHALANNIHSVLTKLNVAVDETVAGKRKEPQSWRGGYDPDFLGDRRIDLPTLTGATAKDAIKAGESPILDYVHFSLVMSRSRRFAIYTAHNIDGKNMKKVSRSGTKWRLDDRLDDSQQVGEDAYVNNPWDRGHLVRRVAVIWGSLEEARRANADTFHYTNSAPQHANFNQDEWLELEEWVLDRADEACYRLCVFTGPIFTDEDQIYRGIRIPKAFWKIIAMRPSGEDRLSVTAFLMNQYELLQDKNGRKYLELQLYQVSVDTIEQMTGLAFDKLRKAQPEAILEAAAVPEGVTAQPWPIISRPQDIVI